MNQPITTTKIVNLQALAKRWARAYRSDNYAEREEIEPLLAKFITYEPRVVRVDDTHVVVLRDHYAKGRVKAELLELE